MWLKMTRKPLFAATPCNNTANLSMSSDTRQLRATCTQGASGDY
jgi:hypothetical protein